MANTLGKRKRLGEQDDSKDYIEPDEDIRTRFQRAFEAKFRPLPEPVKRAISPTSELSEGESAESDWDGIPEHPNEVQVFQHEVANVTTIDEPLADAKSFMVCSPREARVRTSKVPASAEEDSSEAANLKHDLALQRLLKESHLLDPSAFSGAAAVEGKGRLKALDLRLQDLGAKKPLSEQKMPLAHRQGIKTKAADREAVRRREAVENGIVLERASAAPKTALKRRDRGIGKPAVGKFRGGTLKLSSRDVRTIEGPKARSKRKGRPI
ncbi:hypothetical protein BAUCODRAFT_68548 [Baudoinia panamericana UAMH 10762]|uniref:Uncharacterized protein n=1 Tax=Baudoinia panamericana (strain UAMH 10762) TaxID=717646 RepID=M2MZI2_BAUPA|nr:uncharacterized protein BAUCODRAFT_68548 [Baudoinia panamericana UAMH 10762]EMC97008.1 hypothetical protein BAUCODRAFT_68548 [Baudoinia panamericana UAMH 10762]